MKKLFENIEGNVFKVIKEVGNVYSTDPEGLSPVSKEYQLRSRIRNVYNVGYRNIANVEYSKEGDVHKFVVNPVIGSTKWAIVMTLDFKKYNVKLHYASSPTPFEWNNFDVNKMIRTLRAYNA